MKKIIELTGKQFGRLTVLSHFGTNKRNQHEWKCLCECGNEKVVVGSSLRGGLTNSCGCLIGESASKRFKKHGRRNSSEYVCWKGMTQRCSNPNDKAYKNYGGRGITICDRWKNSFDNFLDDMGIKPSDKLSIERNDVNGNYEPSNCIWATKAEQSQNKRIQETNTSGISGVTWNSKLSQWMVRISVSNKRVYLGMFTEKEEAISMRREAEIKYWNKHPS